MAARPAEREEDQRAAMRVVSRVFKASMSCEWEVALRLRQPRYRDATWWTWSEQGEVVGALVCAPLRWHSSTWSAPREGYTLGALAVLPERRGHNIGRRLIASVMAERSAAGAGRGLLFAGISPHMYTPLGFRARQVSAFSVPAPALLALQATPTQLNPLDPYVDLEELAGAWRRSHRGSGPAVYVHRDPADVERSLAQGVDDVFFRLAGPGPHSGTLRLRDLPEADAVQIVECALETRGSSPCAALPSALAAVASLTLQLGRSRVQGWWPSVWGDPAVALGIGGVLHPHPVPPMTVGLDLDLPLLLWASDEL
ncbi:MAG: putative N-acetyltransferase YhbS [Cognaticolwellia sp.]